MSSVQPPVLRPAVLADAPALGALHVRAWQAAYRGLLPDDLLDGLSVEAWTERRRRALEQPVSPLARTWVLERERGVVGFAIAGPCRDADLTAGRAGEVYALYLEPGAVGQGYGRALMGRALDVLREQGFDETVVWVLAGNARARRFYELGGFVLDPAAPDRHVRVQGRELDAPEVRLRRPFA